LLKLIINSFVEFGVAGIEVLEKYGKWLKEKSITKKKQKKDVEVGLSYFTECANWLF
jgi:ABC-type molybdate transport system substrate-binding protein